MFCALTSGFRYARRFPLRSTPSLPALTSPTHYNKSHLCYPRAPLNYASCLLRLSPPPPNYKKASSLLISPPRYNNASICFALPRRPCFTVGTILCGFISRTWSSFFFCSRTRGLPRLRLACCTAVAFRWSCWERALW